MARHLLCRWTPSTFYCASDQRSAGKSVEPFGTTPALIQQGIANLSRPEANPPQTLDGDGHRGGERRNQFSRQPDGPPESQAAVKNTETLQAAIEKAKSAIRDFALFLERDLFPRSRGIYAVGEEHYNLLLKKKHFLTHDAESLLILGEDFSQRRSKSLKPWRKNWRRE